LKACVRAVINYTIAKSQIPKLQIPNIKTQNSEQLVVNNWMTMYGNCMTMYDNCMTMYDNCMTTVWQPRTINPKLKTRNYKLFKL